MRKLTVVWLSIALVSASCTQERVDVDRFVENYALVTIPAPDLTGITDNGKEVLRLYREAANEVDDIYWKQNFGDKEACMPKSITVPGTAWTGSPSCRNTGKSPLAPVFTRQT